MSILFDFWKPNFEKSFLNLLPFSSSQLSHKALPLNRFKVAIRGNLEQTFKEKCWFLLSLFALRNHVSGCFQTQSFNRCT